MSELGPYLSGCTLYSDYSFDASVCWSAPLSEAHSSSLWFALATPTDVSTTSSGETSCLPSQQKTINSWSYFSLAESTSFDGGPGTSRFEVMEVPSSREKCYPGPSGCWYGYKGTECPHGHTQLSVAIQTSTSTIFCCPSAENLGTELTTIGLYGTISKGASYTNLMENGPLVLCVYTGDKISNGVFQTSTFSERCDLPTLVNNVVSMKPFSIKITGTPSLSTTLTDSNATPDSTPPPANSLPTNGTSTNSSTGLSTSSKIGIGVGVSLGSTLLLATIVISIIFRRSKRKRDQKNAVYHGKPELDGQPMSKRMYAHEAQDDQVHELDGTIEPAEIDRSRQILEIEDTGAPVEAHTVSNVPEMEAMHDGTTKIGGISTPDANNTGATSDEQNHY